MVGQHETESTFYLPLIYNEKERASQHYIYLCPLCLQEYILYQNDIWTCSTEFTLDHYPPQSVGGSQTILTCKSCNNLAGSTYEPVLEEWLGMMSFNHRLPNTKIKTIGKPSDKKGWYSGALGIDNSGQLTHSFNSKQLKKFGLNDWHEKDQSLELTITDPDKKKMTKALLKTAYLYCFSNWGYEFTYSKAGDLIRKVLKDESEYPIPITEIYLDEKNTPFVENIALGLVYMHTKTKLYGMFVNIPFSLGSTGYKNIIPVQILNPTENGFEQIYDFQTEFKKEDAINIMITPIINNLETFISFPYSFSWISMVQDLKEQKFNKC